MAVENWVFFGANILFTGFNAWVAWQNWKRQSAADYPTVTASIQHSSEAATAELEIVASNRSAWTWTAKSASMLRPAKPVLYYPLALMLQDPGSGEQWNPRSVDLAKAKPTREVSLFASAPPGGSCREVIWIDGAVGLEGRSITVAITFESTEAQPRRCTVKVKRKMPALITVIPA